MQTLPPPSRTPTTLSSALLALGVGVVVLALTALAMLAGQWMARDRGERPAGTAQAIEDVRVVSQRALRFEDGSDGSVLVVDGSSGELLEVLRGEQGFVRGTLRGFARERRRVGAPTHAPLLLQTLSDQRLVLRDPHSIHRVDLSAFGPDNAAAFARWLPNDHAKSSRQLTTQETSPRRPS